MGGGGKTFSLLFRPTKEERGDREEGEAHICRQSRWRNLPPFHQIPRVCLAIYEVKDEFFKRHTHMGTLSFIKEFQ